MNISLMNRRNTSYQLSLRKNITQRGSESEYRAQLVEGMLSCVLTILFIFWNFDSAPAT